MIRQLFGRSTPLVTQRSSQLTVTGLFIALGLIIPYITGHAFGLPGTLLLPMHFPILLAGLIAGPVAGAVSGILTPLLSSLLTGMPLAYPMLPIMLVQLTTMGVISGLLAHKLRFSIMLSLLTAIVSGWVAYALMFQILLVQNPTLMALSVTAALTTGVPGLLLQLLLIPAIYLAVTRYYRPGQAQRHKQATRDTSNSAIPANHVIQEAIHRVNAPGTSCVVIREGAVIHEADGRGVAPLLDLYEQQPMQLIGSTVVDRIIGKGAAMILVLGAVTRVHGEVMSQSGKDYLERYGITVSYGELVENIRNRAGSDLCPIERSVVDIDDPVQGHRAIRSTLAELRQGTATT